MITAKISSKKVEVRFEEIGMLLFFYREVYLKKNRGEIFLERCVFQVRCIFRKRCEVRFSEVHFFQRCIFFRGAFLSACSRGGGKKEVLLHGSAIN